MSKNIVLIGYRGAGKTSVAKLLSKKLKCAMVSTDNGIAKKSGISINQFVEKFGWDKFREIETDVIRKISNFENGIIDCGGGVIEREENMRRLKSNGIVFWLKVSAYVIAGRIRNSRNRPSLTGKKLHMDEVAEVLSKRNSKYLSYSDYQIETDGKNISKVADEILMLYNKYERETLLCGVIAADNINQAILDFYNIKSADIIELRIDFIKDITKNKLDELLKNLTKKKRQMIIVTCRAIKDRLGLFKTAINNNVDFVDVEFEAEIAKDVLDNRKNTKIILSHHNFNGIPNFKSLVSIYKKIKKLNPDFIKIVAFANSINDNFEIFELLKDKNNLISFCMGQLGEMSRILASKFGSRIIYCSLEEDKKSASGQLTLNEMENLYNFSVINPETNVIGIIGEFAENSMSKYMHNANFKKNGLNFVYVPFKTKKDELAKFMENFRKFKFKGAAVTIPHKVNIINLIDNLDKTAKRIGAVNTIVNDNGILIGYNTDYYGAVQALKEKTDLKNKEILVLGAGGAARAVVYGLKEENAKLTVVNRTQERAKNLAEEFDVKFENFENIKKLIHDNDAIINTTSIGMAPNDNVSIIKEGDLFKGKIVMDIVYKPISTKLIEMARRKQCLTITGDRMLIYQAIRQFKLWTNIEPDFRLMEKELLRQIEKIANEVSTRDFRRNVPQGVNGLRR